MEENRNNGMNGMNPNAGGMNPPMGARGIPNGMNAGMGGMNPQMGAMNSPMNGMNAGMGGAKPAMNGMNAGMGGMNPAMNGMNAGMGGMNPPMGAKPAAPVPPAGAGGATALVPVNKNTKETDKKKKKKRPSIFYNIFAILMFLLMVGGLFLGLLGKYWTYLSPSSLYLPDGVENTTLKGTLVGILIDGIMNIQGYLNFGTGVVGIMGALKNLLPAISLLVLAVCVVYGLIAMLIALFSRTNSRRALEIVSTCMFLGYGSCGLSTLFFGSFAQLDYVSIALAVLGFINCFITAIIANKKIGAMNVFITLFSVAATALFALPMSDMRRYALESTEAMPVIFGFVALGVLYFNFFFTAARICAKKGKIFDLIMHLLQFALIATVFVMTLLATDPMTDMFKLIMPLVCSVGSLALALVTFVLAVVIVFMPKIMKKAEEKKPKAGAKTKEKDKKKKEKDQPDEQRPINPGIPFGAPAPAGVSAQPMMNQQPAQMPQMNQQPPRPMPQQQQPPRPMPNQMNRPPMPQQAPRKNEDEFSKNAKSFKVPFSASSGVSADKSTDPATQAALEKLAQEMRNMKETQSHTVNATPQEDSKTRAAIENLAEQLRTMQDAQNRNNQGDAATKSAIDQLTEELRAMKESQAKAEAERRIAEEAKKSEAEKEAAARKAQEEARIAEAERKAAEAKAEAERIAKEAEAKAEEARLEAQKKTEEERRKLEEERRKLEEERKAAEEARLEAERKAAEAKAEAERREAEAKAEAERRAAEEARLEAERKAAEARAEAERKAEEERRKIEEEKRKLEEERKAVEAAKAEAEKKRQEELDQLKRELRELKTAQNQPVEPDSGEDNMAKIMEELRALKESQGTSSTTYNYLQDDSHGKELSEFEKRMEELIRSSQKKEVTPKREPTAFEKRMAELAARKAAMANGGASANSGVAASPRPAAMPMQQSAVSNEPSRYGAPSLDPFFSTLSTTEVNEFGDIFIANKTGVLEYMPAYAVGGDNKDFFKKAAIYLGRFRGDISRGLMDKLLKYIRTAR